VPVFSAAEAMPQSEFAPAKINLTLEVLGRRADGYHELRSLVAFAGDVGDRVVLGAGRFVAAELKGPFAAAITGGNLVDRAVARVCEVVPGIELGSLTLEKNLPVGSGIGGGSADAAAALRLIRSTQPLAAGLEYSAIARELGADVPVCLKSQAALMTGLGEHLEDVSLPSGLFAVLANPLVSVPANKTAQVFARLAAPPLAGGAHAERAPTFATVSDVIAYAARRGNDLAAPARSLLPIIDTLLGGLSQLTGCRLAQLSGAGPTCFALFETSPAAANAAAELAGRHPEWWIATTRLV
jgi:4-diphosphocytidyl-2-C-methyl-D-erythritol kinase